MTVLSGAAELGDYNTVTSGVFWSSDTNRFRNTWARCAAVINQSADYLYKTLRLDGAGLTTFGVSFLMSSNNDTMAANTQTRFCEFSTGGVGDGRLGLTGETTTGKLRLVTWDGATQVVLATAPSFLYMNPDGGPQRFDMLVENYGSAQGRVRVWTTNSGVSVLQIDYTGQAAVGGAVSLNGIKLGTAPWTAGGWQPWTCYSELIVADGPTNRLQVATCYPNAAGDATTPAFVAGGYGDLDEIGTTAVATFNDVATADAAGQKLFVKLSEIPAGSWKVHGVQLNVLAVKGASGPTKLALGPKTTGGAENFGADQALDVAVMPVRELWTVNPATGVKFTDTELRTPLQLGMRAAA